MIRSLSKLDNVKNAPLIKGLAVQLQEEQIHNDMWRAMLASYGVDHLEIYSRFQVYMGGFSNESLNRMTQGVIAALTTDPQNLSPKSFPDPQFPEPVLALFHHMDMIAKNDSFSFWCHFASQSALEVLICEVATQSFTPGIVGNPVLDRGPHSTGWMVEHTKRTADGKKRSTEEKHLEIAKFTLNRSNEANEETDDIIPVVEKIPYCFSQRLLCVRTASPPALNVNYPHKLPFAYNGPNTVTSMAGRYRPGESQI